MGLFDKKKEKEKKKADFSNVRSGGSSTAGPSPTPASPPAMPEDEVYVVQRGDSLWKIAERFYGRGNDWKRIFEANRDTIEDPDLIHPGQRLKIPKGVAT